MKKVLIIFALALLPTLAIGQDSAVDTKNNDTIETVTNKVPETDTKAVKQATTSKSAVKAQLLKINRKKSNEIISIKAYRKSLQIKVRTVRVC